MAKGTKGGRPEFQPTPAQRRKVSIAAGSGRFSHEEIAVAIGISRNTLEKHFEAELSVGALEKRLEVVEAMHVAAKKGNVTAARSYLEHEPRSAAPPLPKEPDAPKEKPLGKKEQAQADAITAAQGTGWEELLDRPATPQTIQ